MKKKRTKETSGLAWSSLRAEWLGWLLKKAPVFAFGAKFGVFMLLLYGLLALQFTEQMLYTYLEANAWASNLTLNLLRQGTHVTDVTIRSPEFAIAIRRGCDAVEPTGLLCGAILAFPGSLRRKLVGMLAGTVILQVLNLIRIVSLFLIGSHLPAFFPSAHLEIWPAMFIIVAISCFVGWKSWACED